MTQDEIRQLIDYLLPPETWIDFYYSVLPSLQVAATQAVPDAFHDQALQIANDRAAELVGMRIDEDGDLVPNPDARWAISDTTRQQLHDLIINTNPVALPIAIREATAFSPYRSRMIARTEVARVQVMAQLAHARTLGSNIQKRVVLSSTHAEPDDCDDAADDGWIDIDDDFSTGDDGPPIHPHCACVLDTRRAPAEESSDEDNIEQVAKSYNEDQPRDDHGRWTSDDDSSEVDEKMRSWTDAYQTNPGDDRARAALTQLANADDNKYHPGEITVYRAGKIGRKGTSFTKDIEVAKQQLTVGAKPIIVSLDLSRDDPAVDLNQVNPDSRYAHEQEVFVDTRSIDRSRYKYIELGKVAKSDTIDTSTGLDFYDQTSATAPRQRYNVKYIDGEWFVVDKRGNKIRGPFASRSQAKEQFIAQKSDVGINQTDKEPKSPILSTIAHLMLMAGLHYPWMSEYL